MMTLLLVVIFTCFIGVGLPDSLLGTAWPAMYREFDLPISLAGYISSTVSLCTVISSLMSSRLINRFGTYLVTGVSTLLTVIALFGYSLSGHAAFFFLFAIPLGLGAGSIDAALNNYVANHYSIAQMNFLHCFYGIGVTVSPYVMSLALGAGDWRNGYRAIALVQLGIALISFASLPLWRKASENTFAANEEAKTLSLKELFKMPAVTLNCLAFFGINALELCAGQWSSSFFVNTKGLAPDSAAKAAMLFYVGLALGRFLSGLISAKLTHMQIVKLASVILILSVILFALPLPVYFSCAALLLIGLGVGPIYPVLTHLTPQNFGKEISQSVMGVQQAASYTGIMIMPWLFGVLAQGFSTALLPFYLMAMFALYVFPLWSMLKIIRKN